jgi:hypothetical protein
MASKVYLLNGCHPKIENGLIRLGDSQKMASTKVKQLSHGAKWVLARVLQWCASYQGVGVFSLNLFYTPYLFSTCVGQESSSQWGML